MPYASVIIPTINRTDTLRSCLDSLTKQTFKDFEVIIVCRQQEEGLIVLCKDFSTLLNVKIAAQKKKGLVSARNEGWRNANGKIVSFLDDDVTVIAGWLEQIADTFKDSEKTAGVSGPTIIPQDCLDKRDVLVFHTEKAKGNFLWALVVKIYRYVVMENDPFAVGKIFKSGTNSVGANFKKSLELKDNVEVDYLEACNMSYRKDILEGAGGFLDKYKGVGDWSEPDLAFRIKSKGYDLIFNPKVIVYHWVSRQRCFREQDGDSCQRMKNFIYFYFNRVKLNSFDKLLRFGINIVFINLYWVYKSIQTKNARWLLGIKGTFAGLTELICRL